MKNKIIILQLIVLFVGMILFLQNFSFVFSSWANDIIIIGNNDVPVNSLNKYEIKSIFLGERVKWDNTRKISFVILKTKAHEKFLRTYIGNTAAQYRNYWRKMVFTGKSRSPRSFKSAKELLNYIAKTSGAIGYIPAEVYNDNDVKIISVKKETEE